MIEINIHDSIYHLVTTYPEIRDILYDLGFKDIVKPGMLQTMGRIMTIYKGAKMKNIELSDIKNQLLHAGYTVKEINYTKSSENNE